MKKPKITKCYAREIIDSRGNPTVEATVFLDDSSIGVASVPSGASTGKYEAYEKRDRDSERFLGRGVRKAVDDVSKKISPALLGMSAADQKKIDSTLCELDGTEEKKKIGANAILAVSLANAKAMAAHLSIPLYQYLGGAMSPRLPIPMMNILNGGAHASNNVEIQEFMIVPVGISRFSERLRAGCEIYHTLKKILESKGYSTSVGDEGGFAPHLEKDEHALDLICEAIEKAGYTTRDIMIALDAATSEWQSEGAAKYILPKRKEERSKEELINYWKKLSSDYPIMSIEDGLGEEDTDGWRSLTKELGNKIMLVGDDLFVTNEKRLKAGISEGIANSILIKPNQIGTLTETINVINLAKDNGYRFILSHRSGETEDTTIADIAVATGAEFIKSGAPCRSERVAKYNRLLRIEEAMEKSGHFENIPSFYKNPKSI